MPHSSPSFTAPPVALTVAGSDSSAGAGLQADLKTFSAHHVYGLSAVTCVVSELPGQVSQIHAMPAAMLRDQLEILLRGFPVRALKTGMLYSADLITTVAAVLRSIPPAQRPAVVVDPVMIATSGHALVQADAVAAYETLLFPLATVITPNLDEATTLLGEKISTAEQMPAAARALAARYGCAVLLKGGHLASAEAVDLLCQGSTLQSYAAPFVPGVRTHGTGCTYAAALTAGLAQGLDLAAAAAAGKRYVTAAIAQSFQWGSIQALNHAATL